MSTQREKLMESMSKSRDGHAIKLNESEFTAPKQATGLPLSPVRRLAPAEVKLSDENSAAFDPLTGRDFERMKTDIAENGIIVPLIIRSVNDKTLIAGHNRLRAAKDLGLETVPVQYVEKTLSPAQEKAFVIKDNVIRRQLSAAQKEKLIMNLYGAEIHKDNRGGSRGNQHTGGKIAKSSSEPLANLAAKIADETGIAEGTAKRFLAKIRASETVRKAPSDLTGKPQSAPKGKGRGQDIKALKNALRGVKKANKAEARTILEKWLKKETAK